ncbi:MAG: ferrous iron transport protein A [Alphaproteobacteria bacterium]|nr:ferrous iron transport protein A [Alphaproteobacteria bacterium]
MKLSELLPGRLARVESFAGATAELETKLREVGFSEGSAGACRRAQ